MDKARIDTVLAPVGAAEQARREGAVRKDFLRKAKQVAARVPFAVTLGIVALAVVLRTPFAAAFGAAARLLMGARVRFTAAFGVGVLVAVLRAPFVMAFGVTLLFFVVLVAALASSSFLLVRLMSWPCARL